jgi:hypothetical protein
MKERKHIERNRESFNDMEPSAGHAERFEALLIQQNKQMKLKQKPAKRIRLISAVSVAASIAVFVAVAIKVRTPEHVESFPNRENVVTNDFQSVNEYYSRQMQQHISDIMCKLAHTDQKNQALLTEDLQIIMEENAGFINEMSRNENEETAVYYLRKHYKANIRMLEDINVKLGKYTNC